MPTILPRICLLTLALTLPTTLASAAVVPVPTVAIASDTYVEHLSDAARVLERADQLRRGDRVITVVSWRRALPGGAFTVVNPLPRSVQFQGSADGTEQVSADGGRTWGRLGQLRIANRLATPEDITHLRWRVASPASTGQITYSAIVR